MGFCSSIFGFWSFGPEEFQLMANKSSSARWKKRQAADPWVKKAIDGGWRSRAVFKLAEIDEKYRLLRQGGVVVDLGAAPGGWAQYAAKKALPKGRVIALDILDMDPIDGVEIICGDFTADAVLQHLLQSLGDLRADLVMSDMSPNITGMRSVDQPRSMYLVELAFELASQTLRSNGAFVTKVFQGEGFDDLVRVCRKRFRSVKIRKPAASRQESRETYIIATGFRL